MRAIEAGGSTFDSLKLVERPVPQPAAGEVQIRMVAATLNYRDLLLVLGGYAGGRPETYVPLSCGAGVVSAVGSGVTRFKVGDRVAPCFFQDWADGPRTDPGMGLSLGGSVDGTAREYACYSEQYVVKVPDALGLLDAATLPCAALTAWNALFVARATKPGDVVLLQGTGGVSIAGLQLAKMAGATVIITSSSRAKLERARTLGADYGINYREVPNWGERAKQITGERGVDVVLEVGGMETLEQTSAALAPGGLIAGIGLLGGTRLGKGAHPALKGIRVGSRVMFEDMNRAIAGNGMQPVVDRVYPLEGLSAAMKALKAGTILGKVAIQIGEG